MGNKLTISGNASDYSILEHPAQITDGANGNNSQTCLLELNSVTRGFLLPRMTGTQRDAISSPPAGLIVYNLTTNKLNFYNGSAWEIVTSAT